MGNQPQPPAERPERAMERSQEHLKKTPERTLDSLESVRALIHEFHSRLETDPTEQVLGEAWGNIETATESLAQENATVRNAREECRSALKNEQRDVALAIERLQALETALRGNERSREQEQAEPKNESARFRETMRTLTKRLSTEQSAEVKQRLQVMTEQHLQVPEVILKETNDHLETLVTGNLNVTDLGAEVVKILDTLLEQAQKFTQDSLTKPVGDLANQNQPIEIVPVNQETVESEDSTGDDDDYDNTAKAGTKTDVAAATTAEATIDERSPKEKVENDVSDLLVSLVEINPPLQGFPDALHKFVKDNRHRLDSITFRLNNLGGFVAGLRSGDRISLAKDEYIVVNDKDFYMNILKERLVGKDTTTQWLEDPANRIDLYNVPPVEAANNTKFYAQAA